MNIPNKGRISLLVLFSLGALFFSGCAPAVKQIKELVAFSKCQFRMVSVEKTTLAAFALQGGQIIDIEPYTLMNLQQAYTAGSLPLQFTLNLEVKNPNAFPAGMNRMDWILLLDNNQVASGMLEPSMEIPPNNGTKTFPLVVSFDLVKALSGKTLDSMVNLAMNIAGKGTWPSQVTFQVKPGILIEGQMLEYPGYVTVSQDFPAQ